MYTIRLWNRKMPASIWAQRTMDGTLLTGDICQYRSTNQPLHQNCWMSTVIAVKMTEPSERCTCWKYGLPCTNVCRECRGVSCTNSVTRFVKCIWWRRLSWTHSNSVTSTMINHCIDNSSMLCHLSAILFMWCVEFMLMSMLLKFNVVNKLQNTYLPWLY